MSVVCRTCLHQIYDDNFLSINDSTVVKNQLSQCIPEMTLSLVTNSIMCTACSAALDFAYNFKSRCLQAEKHILNHMNETASSSNIDGTRLIEILFKPLTNGIKRELIVPDEPQVDYFMSTEEVAVDDDENATDDCTNDEHSLEGGIEIMKQDLEDPDYKPCDAFPVVDNPFSSLTSIEEEADVSSGETLENMDYPNFEEYNLNDSSIVNRKPWKNGLKATYRVKMLEEDNLSEEVLLKDAKADDALVPHKSKKVYEKEYCRFEEWLRKNSVSSINETVMMAYFQDLSEVYSPNSLFTKFSMLRKELIVKKKIRSTEKFVQLQLYLKQIGKKYQPKKSKVLTREHVLRFLKEAPTEKYLLDKIALVIGVFGACRRSELVKMRFTDVRDLGTHLLIDIPQRKNGQPRSFLVIEESEMCALKLIRHYISLRPGEASDDRFFLSYRDKRCTVQPVGKNNFGSIPSKIAAYLGLPDAKAYTGHCLRRTAATLHSDAGGNSESLMRLGTRRLKEFIGGTGICR